MSYALHGTLPRHVEAIRRYGLRPGPKTRWGEPAGVWLSTTLEGARLYAVDRDTWAISSMAAQVPERKRKLKAPKPCDEDALTFVIEVSGLRLTRHTFFGPTIPHTFVSFAPIPAERVVGTIAEVGVAVVVSNLWRP